MRMRMRLRVLISSGVGRRGCEICRIGYEREWGWRVIGGGQDSGGQGRWHFLFFFCYFSSLKSPLGE